MHSFEGGVRLHLSKDAMGDLCAFKATDHAIGKSHLHHKGIGNDKGVAARQFVQIADGVFAVANFGVAIKLSQEKILQ